MAKIWCLFSVDNNWDQPNCNLVCWWTRKPTVQMLTTALGYPAFPCVHHLDIVAIWREETTRIINTDYRIEEVSEGEIL